MNTQLLVFFQLTFCTFWTVQWLDTDTADWHRLNLLTNSRHTSSETHEFETETDTDRVWINAPYTCWLLACCCHESTMPANEISKKQPNQNRINILTQTSMALFMANSKLSTNAHLVCTSIYPEDRQTSMALFVSNSKLSKKEQLHISFVCALKTGVEVIFCSP